ncbi:MAG TPA: glycosyl hydrolase [Opitutaceae bacterium]
MKRSDPFRGAPGLAILATAVVLFASAALSAAEPAPTLEASFREPPADARPMMRWWWFGPAVTLPDLERELRLMKEGGIGGVEIQPVYALSLDDPERNIKNVPYLSPAFLDALRFTAEKTKELGMRVDLTVGSGWPYGGPEVPIGLASARLRWEPVKVAPGVRRVSLPDIGAGERLIAAFAAGTTRELKDVREGWLHLSAEDAAVKEVWFFVSSRTGQMVKRAAIGAEGFVLDHYSRAAIDKYLREVGDPMLKAMKANIPYSVFCDSLEVYMADWTPDFLEEFKRLRGYDLRPHLPALVSDIGPQTASIRHDWGQTLMEVFEARFAAPLQAWAAANNTRLRFQAYGSPPVAISTNRYADISEGEGDLWDTLTASRWASSASHIYGRTVTSSETWTWLHSPVFRATPLDMKAVADLNFLQGINQLIGHGWPSTPEAVDYPGWRFYAAAVFNEKNPWYALAMPDLTRYLARVSHLLRQGRPVNDVAVYLPNHDGWASFNNEPAHDTSPVAPSLPSPVQSRHLNLFRTLRHLLGPDLLPQLLHSGFNFDFFDDRILGDHGKLEGKTLALGEGRYQAVILPSVERIPLATLRKLEEFARQGGTVIATRRKPDLAPGLREQEAERSGIQQTARRLFEGAGAPGMFIADERQLGAALAKRIQPDVIFPAGTRKLGFVHRRTGTQEIYFVANTENRPFAGRVGFRAGDLTPEVWNPLNGEAQALDIGGRDGAFTSIDLELAPYESVVLVFTKATQAPRRPRLGAAASTIDLSTGWQLRFGGQTATLPALRSWTEDPEKLYYSGTGSYEKTITAGDWLRPGATVQLDFGKGQPHAVEAGANPDRLYARLHAPIRDAAVIYVNDQRVGSLWAPPYMIDITSYLKPGENRLRVEVANLAVNHMAGRAQPDYTLLHLRYGQKFDPQDMKKIKPEPSGLLGPVKLIVSGRRNP